VPNVRVQCQQCGNRETTQTQAQMQYIDISSKWKRVIHRLHRKHPLHANSQVILHDAASHCAAGVLESAQHNACLLVHTTGTRCPPKLNQNNRPGARPRRDSTHLSHQQWRFSISIAMRSSGGVWAPTAFSPLHTCRTSLLLSCTACFVAKEFHTHLVHV
jgi:hypothetical protein